MSVEVRISDSLHPYGRNNQPGAVVPIVYELESDSAIPTISDLVAGSYVGF